MKRILLVTALVLLVLTAGFAEGTTWTNPDEAPFIGALTLPRSMMSAVSNGIYYDEVDTIILSPAELSNYSGFSIITSYGNYEYDYQTGTAYADNWVNPFTTTSLDQTGPGTNVGNFLLGATGEFFGFRGGLITSFRFDSEMRLDEDGNATVDASVWDENENVIVDNDADGTADFTYSNIQSYTDYNTTTEINMGAGVDLEFIGASLYGNFNSTVNHLGGSYVYTKAINNDADSLGSVDPVDVVTSKTVSYGFGEDGKVKNNPLVSSTDWVFGARGHLPLEIADISMPVKADFYVGGSTPTTFPGVEAKTAFDLTAVNVTADDVTETSTISAVYGEAGINGVFDPNPAGFVYSGLNVYNQASFTGLITAVQGDDFALDPKNSRNVNFKTGIKGLIDPEIIISDVFSVRTRGQLGYELDVTSQKVSAVKSVVYNEALVGQTEKAVYNWSQTGNGTFGSTVNTIDLELGGLMDLHNRENTIGVVCGLFYQPEFKFTGNTQKDAVQVTTVSYVDPANTTPDATAIGQTVGFGGGEVQGTQVITAYGPSYGESGLASSEIKITNTFYIPASVRVGFAEGAMELVGGYLLKHDNSITTTKTYDSTTAPVSTTLTSASGTDYSTPASSTVSSNITEGSTTVLTSNGRWAGNMSFMLRWNAMKDVTVDFYGATIMDALNFDMFGDDAAAAVPPQRDGLNFFDIIDNLGISVTISAE